MVVYRENSNHLSAHFLSKQPPTGALRRPSVSFGARDAQCDLGAGSRSAPNTHLRTDLSGAFAHSGNAVVTGATVLQDFRRNAFPIIPNPQAEQPFCVGNFDFDMVSPRVAESIS